MPRKFLGFVLPLAIIIGWEALWYLSANPLESISRPSQVALALIRGLTDGSVLLLTWQTFESALLGFAIATSLGVLTGIFLGLAPQLERIVRPTVDLLRPIPSVALIPLAMLIYGFGVRMESSIVAFACIWPVLLITISAVRGIEPGLIEVSHALQLSTWQRISRIVLPAAMSRIAVGLQLALAIALVVAVTVEIVINPRGLGYGMMSAQQALQFDRMYALLLWTGLVGWGLSRLSQALINHYSPASRVQLSRSPA